MMRVRRASLNRFDWTPSSVLATSTAARGDDEGVRMRNVNVRCMDHVIPDSSAMQVTSLAP
jgi:hypothetical protein